MMMRVWWNKAAYLMVAAKEGWDRGGKREGGSNNLTFTRFYLPMILGLPESFNKWDSGGHSMSKLKVLSEGEVGALGNNNAR